MYTYDRQLVKKKLSDLIIPVVNFNTDLSQMTAVVFYNEALTSNCNKCLGSWSYPRQNMKHKRISKKRIKQIMRWVLILAWDKNIVNKYRLRRMNDVSLYGITVNLSEIA